MAQQKRTKIIATIGPASSSQKVIRQLGGAGANVMRLNFSHGDHKEHKEKIDNIRSVFPNNEVSILQDLPGPKIRLGEIPEGAIGVSEGEVITLSAQPENEEIPVDYPGFAEIVEVGGEILIEDGTKILTINSIEGTKVHAKVQIGGTLKSRKGINIPGAKLKESSFTEEDKQHLDFGIQQGVDLVALSFVESADSIQQARDFLRTNNAEGVAIIAKVETRLGLQNIDSILESADGIMIARGDLGVQVPYEEVPFLQTELIKKALRASKPVVVATQMLKSMMANTRPSRADVTDIANAALQGADAVMLSEEVALGKYPVDAVKVMASVLRHAEAEMSQKHPSLSRSPEGDGTSASIAHSAVHVAHEIGAEAIFVFTESGSTARLISRHRPRQPIYALTPNSSTCAALNLSWGVNAFLVESVKDVEGANALVQKTIKEHELPISGAYVFSAGIPFAEPGSTNIVFAGKV